MWHGAKDVRHGANNQTINTVAVFYEDHDLILFKMTLEMMPLFLEQPLALSSLLNIGCQEDLDIPLQCPTERRFLHKTAVIRGVQT